MIHNSDVRCQFLSSVLCVTILFVTNARISSGLRGICPGFSAGGHPVDGREVRFLSVDTFLGGTFCAMRPCRMKLNYHSIMFPDFHSACDSHEYSGGKLGKPYTHFYIYAVLSCFLFCSLVFCRAVEYMIVRASDRKFVCMLRNTCERERHVRPTICEVTTVVLILRGYTLSTRYPIYDVDHLYY